MNASRYIRAMAAGVAVCVAAACAAASSEPSSKPASQPPKHEPPVKQKVELTGEAAEKQAEGRIAHIRLSGAVLSSPPDFSFFAGESQGMTLRDWVQRLAKARNDERVGAVALEIDSPEMDWAQGQELADAVQRLGEAKPVYAHIIDGGAVPYLVGSAAKDLAMEPSGELRITGLGAEMMFYKGTLDWLGIRAQMVQVGKYKGASEPFMRTAPSEEWKGEFDKMLDDLYAQLCEQIASQRKLTVPHVKQAIDEGPHDGRAAKEFRLVDRLACRADWQQYVQTHVAEARKQKAAEWVADYEAKKPRQVDFSNPLALFGMMMGGRPQEATKEPTIAIIHADGVIVPGKSGEGFLGERFVGDKTMAECFQQAAKDDKVKAVIFRINSPGGSALASELIYQSAKACAARKPVIVSIEGMAASGGYYIAMAGQKILADPAAITGSIGVISGKMAIQGLLDKVGITTYEVTRGRNAGLWMSRPWDQREEAVIRRMATRTYDTFVSRVKDARAGKIKDVDAVAQGRIFTARQALQNGMVDQIGGLREAIIATQSAAKIDHSYILVLPRPKTLMDMLYGGESSQATLEGRFGSLARAAQTTPPLLAAGPRKQAGLAYLLTLARLLARESTLTALPCYVTVRP
jgi:protease-4